MSYTPPSGTINPSWLAAQPYRAPTAVVVGWWAGIAGNAFPVGLRSLSFGRAFVAHRWVGWDSLSTGTPRVTYEWEYRPPHAELRASWVGALAYTPPAGTINAQWTQGAGPVEDQYLDPAGFDAASFGLAVVVMDQPAAPAGWDSLLLGGPSVGISFTLNASWAEAAPYSRPFAILPGWWKSPDEPTVFAAGLRSLTFGTAQIRNATFPVFAGGWDSSAFSHPAVQNFLQIVEPEGFERAQFGTHKLHVPEDQEAKAIGLAATQWGTAFVAWQLRWVEHVGHGHLSQASGTPRIDYRVRTVRVPWTVFTQYGTARVSRQIELGPQGWDGAQAGAPAVAHGNVIEPAGWRSSEAPSLPWVSRSPRPLWHAQGSPATQWGMPEVQLWARYLQHAGFPFESQGTKFGTYTHAFNRNRTVAPYGYTATRMAITALVSNAARALRTLPIEGTQWGADTFIAPGVRHVRPAGLNSFRASNFGTRIHNAAAQLRPAGWRSAAVGRPEWVESNLQTIRHHSGSLPVFGRPFVAPGVRTVVQYGWLSASHRVGSPRVWFNRLQLVGFDSAVPGIPALLGPFRRTIAPRWVLRDRVGSPAVRNVTPQLYPPGRPYTEFGNLSWVSFLVRAVAPFGIWQGGVGQHAIRDRAHYPAVRGWDGFTTSLSAHQIRNVNPDPPSLRTIAPASIFTDDEDNWRQIYAQFFGRPVVGANSIRPEGIQSQRFGTADMLRQGAIVESHAAMTQWGDYQHTRVELRNRSIVAEGIPRRVDAYGKPSLSPHTIWAPLGAPQQAVHNHPTRLVLHAVGGLEPEGYDHSRWPWFGHTQVMNKNRVITQFHDPYSAAAGKPMFGDHTIVEWRQRISLHENGIESQRFGLTVLHPHTKRIWGIGLLSQQFGEHTVEPGDKTQYVERAGNILEAAFGAAFLWGGVRYVQANGFPHTQWGNNEPMVHYPRRFEIGGGALTKWGDTWVSHRVRHLFPEGFEATEADWTDFRARMRVRLLHRPHAAGWEASAFGESRAALRHQFIRPYMIPPPGLRCTGPKVAHA